VSRLRLTLRARIVLLLVLTFFLGAVALRTGAPVTVRLARSYGDRNCDFFIKHVSCHHPYLDQDRRRILLTLLASAAGVMLMMWFIAGLLLSPLRRMTATVGRLGPQNLGQRIRLAGPRDSMRRLADSVDEAMDRVAAGYDGQRRFAANASHELLTPLAVQRTLVEVALEDDQVSPQMRELGRQLLATNERNENLIEGLLVLADSDSGLVTTTPVRLDMMVRSLLDGRAERAQQSGITVSAHLDELWVEGDPVLLERMVGNLLDNALRYNVNPGWVEVTVTRSPTLRVHNSGGPVSAEDIPRLFQPFRRLNADRTHRGGGAGLGLSIVRSVALAHGGSAAARPGREGGLDVEVALPGSRPAAL
jgi:signal transduction histidine kinase